jgi:hypothetical protein
MSTLRIGCRRNPSCTEIAVRTPWEKRPVVEEKYPVAEDHEIWCRLLGVSGKIVV